MSFSSKTIEKHSTAAHFPTIFIPFLNKCIFFSLDNWTGLTCTTKEFVAFYTTCICPINMKYMYVWAALHHGVLKYLSDELESLHKHASRIIFPLLSSMSAANLISLAECRYAISAKLFANIQQAIKITSHTPPPSLQITSVKNLHHVHCK